MLCARKLACCWLVVACVSGGRGSCIVTAVSATLQLPTARMLTQRLQSTQSRVLQTYRCRPAGCMLSTPAMRRRRRRRRLHFCTRHIHRRSSRATAAAGRSTYTRRSISMPPPGWRELRAYTQSPNASLGGCSSPSLTPITFVQPPTTAAPPPPRALLQSSGVHHAARTLARAQQALDRCSDASQQLGPAF